MEIETPRKLDVPVYGERVGEALRARATEGALERVDVLVQAQRVLRKAESRSPLQEPISKFVILARTLEARVETTRCVEEFDGERNVACTEILEAEAISGLSPRRKSRIPPITS